MTKTQNRSDKLRGAHEKLEQAVEEIAPRDDWSACSRLSRSSIATELLPRR
jgi:hypothetical protein